MNEKLPSQRRQISGRAIAVVSAVALTGGVALDLVSHREQSGRYVEHIEGTAQCMATLAEVASQDSRTFRFTVQVRAAGAVSVKSAKVEFWNNQESPVAIAYDPEAEVHPARPNLSTIHTFKGDAGTLYTAQGQVELNDGSIITCPPVNVATPVTPQQPDMLNPYQP